MAIVRFPTLEGEVHHQRALIVGCQSADADMLDDLLSVLGWRVEVRDAVDALELTAVRLIFLGSVTLLPSIEVATSPMTPHFVLVAPEPLSNEALVPVAVLLTPIDVFAAEQIIVAAST